MPKQTKTKKKNKLNKLLSNRRSMFVAGALIIGGIAGGLYAANLNSPSLADGTNPFGCPMLPPPPVDHHPLLVYGSTGDCVRHLQFDLNAIYFFGSDKRFRLPKNSAPLGTDGVFGAKTLERVRQFQFQVIATGEYLPGGVDGKVGPETGRFIHGESCYFITNC